MSATGQAMPAPVDPARVSLESIGSDLPDAPALGEDEVHLWRLPLDPPGWPLDVLGLDLAPDELERAQRYVFRRDREHFVAARGYLRAVLAHYVGCDPREIEFGYAAHGKPYLPGPSAANGLTFNLSHTRGLGLCAVARGREVGIDVEQIRPEVDVLGVARSTFSPSERVCLEALPSELRLDAFYACWTRKEAYIKARGDGLSYPLDAFDVSLAHGEPAMLLRSAEGQGERQRWALHDIDAGAGYAAALAVERPVVRLSTFGWP